MNVLEMIASGLLGIRALARRRARQAPRHWRVGQVEDTQPVGTLPQ